MSAAITSRLYEIGNEAHRSGYPEIRRALWQMYNSESSYTMTMEESQQAFVDKLNQLLASAQEPDRAALLEVIQERLPASDDPRNMCRAVLADLLVTSLKDATPVEKLVFINGLMSQAFEKEQEAQDRAKEGVEEMPLVPGLDGREILRVFQEMKNGSMTGAIVLIVDAAAESAMAWGGILHDVAANICDHAVERGVVTVPGRKAMLGTIATFFMKAHKRPPAPAGSHQQGLDS